MVYRTFTALVLGVILFAWVPSMVHASAELEVTPAVIDEKGKSRDIMRETITIKNNTNRVLALYPSVNDVDVSEGKQTFISAQNARDAQESLANWIELSRGLIQLGPGETREVPFVIHANMNALSGNYHAVISFSEGDNRENAENRSALGTVSVNVEILSDTKEILQLGKFVTDGIFFTGDDVLFKYQLENIGNAPLTPGGEIRIYDRKGAEVAAVDINKEGKTITPEQLSQMASVWSGAEGYGKFKALLNVNYGSGKNQSVQDTVFFWIIPWKQILVLFTISIVLVIGGTLYFHRWYVARVHQMVLGGTPALAGVPAHMPMPDVMPGAASSAADTRVPLSTHIMQVMAPLKGVFTRKPHMRTPANAQNTVSPPSAPVPPSRPRLKDVLAEAPAKAEPSATIDLRKRQAPQAAASSQGEALVINLKKR